MVAPECAAVAAQRVEATQYFQALLQQAEAVVVVTTEAGQQPAAREVAEHKPVRQEHLAKETLVVEEPELFTTPDTAEEVGHLQLAAQAQHLPLEMVATERHHRLQDHRSLEAEAEAVESPQLEPLVREVRAEAALGQLELPPQRQAL